MPDSQILPFIVNMSYQPYCPHGSVFYVCRNQPGFIGCCNTQPCDNGCPIGDLKPASWKIDYSGDMPHQKCNPGSSWHKCQNATQSFIGCCKSDPCSRGCPTVDLTPAFVDDSVFSPSLSTTKVPISSTTSSSPSPSSSLSSSSSSFTRTGFTTSTPNLGGVSTETQGDQTARPTVTTVPKSTSTSSNAAAIAGGIAGGIAGLALLVGLLAICRRRRKIKSQLGIDEGRFSAWNSGQSRSIQPGSAELDEIKQGPSTSKLPLLLHIIIP